MTENSRLAIQLPDPMTQKPGDKLIVEVMSEGKIVGSMKFGVYQYWISDGDLSYKWMIND